MEPFPSFMEGFCAKPFPCSCKWVFWTTVLRFFYVKIARKLFLVEFLFRDNFLFVFDSTTFFLSVICERLEQGTATKKEHRWRNVPSIGQRKLLFLVCKMTRQRKHWLAIPTTPPTQGIRRKKKLKLAAAAAALRAPKWTMPSELRNEQCMLLTSLLLLQTRPVLCLVLVPVTSLSLQRRQHCVSKFLKFWFF
jgi:hypothetical protein